MFQIKHYVAYDSANDVSVDAPRGGVDKTYGAQLAKLKASGVKLYWIGAGTTDTAREGALNLSGMVKKLAFNSFYREIPGRHYWFLWRNFPGDYGSRLFR